MRYVKKPEIIHAMLRSNFPGKCLKNYFFSAITAFFLVLIQTTSVNSEVYIEYTYSNMQYYCHTQSGLLIRAGNVSDYKNEKRDADMRMDSGGKLPCRMGLISALRLHSLSSKTLRCMYRKCHLQCMMNEAPEIVRSENGKMSQAY
ncbi:hypothetical protein [Pantoea agglomerans]|uniref:hypothetical protein n=1 Tax=Enterobacter agglomerans TaxID=549 RepID=UPI0010455E5B|nr:hypothetical protein [Pantoea agglomerans]TCZ22837.1 hypothetical protein EYB39_21865 [Pantoea agglomerans]